MMPNLPKSKSGLVSMAMHVAFFMIALCSAGADGGGKEKMQADFDTLQELIHKMVESRNTIETYELAARLTPHIDEMAEKLKAGAYRMSDLEAEIKKAGIAAKKLLEGDKTCENMIKTAGMTVYVNHLFTIMFKADKKRLLEFIEANIENESLGKHVIPDALSLVGITFREAIGKKRLGYKDEELLPCFMTALRSGRREIRNRAFSELVDENMITGKPLGKAEAIQVMKEIVGRKDVPFERIEPYYELLSEVGECRDEYIKKMESYVFDKKNSMIQRYDYYYKLKKLGVETVDPFTTK